jgi:hypothetical protein
MMLSPLRTLPFLSLTVFLATANAQQATDHFTIRLDGTTLSCLRPPSYSNPTILVWRKYDLAGGGWVANCCPFEFPKDGRISMNASIGLVAQGSLNGLGSVSLWLADADSPYKQVSNIVTSAKLVEGVGRVPATIDTGTEFTFVDSGGQKIVSKGNFVATGNKRKTAIKYWFTGKTEGGLLLGGAQIEEDNWVGLYTPLKADEIKKAVTTNNSKPLEDATEGVAAKYRAKRAVLLELSKPSTK